MDTEASSDGCFPKNAASKTMGNVIPFVKAADEALKAKPCMKSFPGGPRVDPCS